MAFTHNSKLADSEPRWGGLDKTSLPRIAHADEGEADKKTSWRFPHHWIKGGGGKNDMGVFTTGTMYLHKGGLDAAWARANQEGIDTSGGVKAHIEAHRRAIGVAKGNMAAFTQRLEGYSTRAAALKGREYIVAPIVFMVEGVHAPLVQDASSGEIRYGGLFFSNSVISRNVEQWNGLPVAVNHPKDAYGNIISCRQPDVMQAQGVGSLWNSRFNDGLKGEVWIDVAEAERLMPAALKHIRSGRPVEVSIGAGFMVEDESGVWNGEEYNGVVTYVQGDHVAILLDEKGACSVEDGCGIRAAAKEQADDVKKEKKEEVGMSEKKVSAAAPDPCDGCSAIIDELVGKEGAWNESDREWMNDLGKETLENMLRMKPIDPEGDGAADDGGSQAEDVKAVPPAEEEPAQPAQTDNAAAAAQQAKPLKLDDMPKEVQAMVAASRQKSEADRKEYASIVFANARNTMSAEDLEKLPADVLKNMVNMLGANPVFSGANGFVAAEGGKMPEPLGLPRFAAEKSGGDK